MRGKQAVMGLAAIILLAIAAVRIIHSTGGSSMPLVPYSFWCDSGHLHSFAEMAAAGRESHPRGASESVLVCATDGCEKPSHPVDRCRECGARYLLYVLRNQVECPQCRPEIAKAAAARGLNAMPPDLPQN